MMTKKELFNNADRLRSNADALRAAAEGKVFQYKKKQDDEWKDLDVYEKGIIVDGNDLFRIKPESAYSPYDFDSLSEAIRQHGNIIRHPQHKWCKVIVGWDSEQFYLCDGDLFDYEALLRCVWFDDGSVCGVLTDNNE